VYYDKIKGKAKYFIINVLSCSLRLKSHAFIFIVL
jgi:hypothetical protein